ncbi:hypothetical protein Leryth_003942 [Lithospermum erythrorhizon]|nr:hypothetical protein Leryth_003942 [Lithospermum erythrorhizon]
MATCSSKVLQGMEIETQPGISRRSYQVQSGDGLRCFFTYLRMNQQLFEPNNWRNMVDFVRNMADGSRITLLPESDTSRTNLYVGFIKEKSEKKINKSLLV